MGEWSESAEALEPLVEPKDAVERLHIWHEGLESRVATQLGDVDSRDRIGEDLSEFDSLHQRLNGGSDHSESVLHNPDSTESDYSASLDQLKEEQWAADFGQMYKLMEQSAAVSRELGDDDGMILERLEALRTMEERRDSLMDAFQLRLDTLGHFYGRVEKLETELKKREQDMELIAREMIEPLEERKKETAVC